MWKWLDNSIKEPYRFIIVLLLWFIPYIIIALVLDQILLALLYLVIVCYLRWKYK